MELKRISISYFSSTRLLLIVPYGIETIEKHFNVQVPDAFNRTLWNWNDHARSSEADWICLLIVPYGIETSSLTVDYKERLLLIVPYGIETTSEHANLSTCQKLLIVPYGIETN